MTPNEILIESGWKFVAAVSGGGQEIFGDLTRHGGMSSTLLEGIIPYHPLAYQNLIGGKADKWVSREAARAAAMACYRKALTYKRKTKEILKMDSEPNMNVFGFASTGSVVKPGGEREGRKHQVFMAIQDYERTLDMSITFRKTRTREEEEKLAADCIRQALQWGCHRFGDIKRKLEDDDEFLLDSAIALPNTREVVHGTIRKTSDVKSRAIFASSCNPFHDGHLAMVEDASRRLDCAVDIELCVVNADKPGLDYLTIRERFEATRKFLSGNRHVGQIILTSRPLFFDKADSFPGATFIVGDDTFDRIMDPNYYRRGYDSIDAGLDSMTAWGSEFLVYPRKGYDRKTIVLPSRANKITTFVNPYDGYESSDISSTAIRQRMADDNS